MQNIGSSSNKNTPHGANPWVPVDYNKHRADQGGNSGHGSKSNKTVVGIEEQSLNNSRAGTAPSTAKPSGGGTAADKNAAAKRRKKEALNKLNRKPVENRAPDGDMTKREAGSPRVKTPVAPSVPEQPGANQEGVVEKPHVGCADESKAVVIRSSADLKEAILCHKLSAELEKLVEPKPVFEPQLVPGRVYVTMEDGHFDTNWRHYVAHGVTVLHTGLFWGIGGDGRPRTYAENYKGWLSQMDAALQRPREMTRVKIEELITRADPLDRDYIPLKRYGFNAYYPCTYSHAGFLVLARQHPGIRPQGYTASTFEFTLQNFCPELDVDTRTNTALVYHQYALAAESMRNCATGGLKVTMERL